LSYACEFYVRFSLLFHSRKYEHILFLELASGLGLLSLSTCRIYSEHILQEILNLLLRL